jgi:PAS domain S-box-containing protein
MLDLVHDAVIIRDLGGRILAINAAAEALYGLPRKDALGRSAHELLGAGQTAEMEGQLRATGRWEGETVRRSADGRALTVHARLALEHDAQGRPTRIVEAARDIGRSRDAEAALHESEHRYRNLFHAMAASFWELDFNGVGGMLRELRRSGVTDLAEHFARNPEFVRAMMRATQVLDVNEQSVSLFGGDKAALLGDVERFWPEASSAVFAASVIAAVGGAPAYASETRLRTLEGREFEVLFTACFPPDGVSRGKLLIGVIDISERVKAQAMLARLQSEFAHAARVSMLGELAASIAHEVNQPLAAIATNASAGLRWLSRPAPDVAEARALSTRIVADAERAAAIIQRVRAMAAKQAPEPAAISINAVIKEALLFLHHEMRSRDVRVTLDLAPDLPPTLADRTLLQQVMVNLTVNAMQAMAQAGAAEREIRIASARDVDALVVTIEDRGPGVPPDALPRLFESFYTTKADGLGMGLPICRSILETHGGSISASNREGGGARFTFALPAAAPPS